MRSDVTSDLTQLDINDELYLSNREGRYGDEEEIHGKIDECRKDVCA